MQPQEKVKLSYRSSQKASHWPWLGSIITFTICISLGITIFIFRQNIIDQFNYFVFKPSSSVSAIADDAKMTSSGLFYFYTSLPQVDSSADFNVNCVRKEAASAILGCYSNQRIYIYDVKNDERLVGVKTVSAAHEMLHSAWDRLSGSEKSRLGSLLEPAYQRLKNSELIARMEYYDREQPGDHIQELHSILGTEFADLGDELENYYSRYFEDRKSLVLIHDKYSKTFAEITNQQKLLLEQINALRGDLEVRVNDYNQAVKKLNSDIASLESERMLVDTSDISQVALFNSKRSALVKRINSLNAQNKEISDDQTEYDNLINEYNKLVFLGNDLTNSLDSTLESPSSL